MGKNSKLKKIHQNVMCASEEIGILADCIAYYCEKDVEKEILARIINEKSHSIGRSNEKMGTIFKF